MNQFAHRQARARLKVVYPDGTAAAGRRIQADQISHRFLFGCGGSGGYSRAAPVIIRLTG